MIARRKNNLKLGLLPRMDAIIGKRKTTYYFRTYDNKRINLGHDLAEAKRKAVELTVGKPQAGTVAELLDVYLKEASIKLAPRSHADNQSNEKRLRLVFGEMSISALRPSHVATYLDKHPAPVRANREIATLSSAYALAVRRGLVDVNPCKGVRRNKEKPRTRLVMDWELDDLLKLANQKGGSFYLVGLIAEFAWLTGQRRQDILKLHRSQLSDDGITFKPQKIKQGEAQITVHMKWSERLLACVQTAQKIERKASSMFVFANQAGHTYTDAGFKAIWNRLQVAYAKQGGERFHFHDLRAKYVTDKEGRGEDSTEGTAHKNRAMVERTYDRRRIRKATPAA